ncbi:MAG: DNRLRE domain-containing protein [Phycisphaerae bacterium]
MRKCVILSMVLGMSVGLTSITSASVVSAVLVEDTYIQSNAADTNYATSVIGVYCRNYSTVTRAGFLQFTLPQIAPGQSVNQVTLRMRATQTMPQQRLELAGLAVNPDLSAMTWNSVITDNIVAGRLPDTYNVEWGSQATVFAGEEWVYTPTVALWYAYTDANISAGLAKYISDRISTAGPVTVTIAVGPAGAALVTDASFGSSEAPEGISPVLEITLTKPAVSGTVTLDNYTGDRSEVAVTVDFKQSGISVHKETVLLGSDGSFVTTGPVSAGTYDIYIKSCAWLQKAFLSQIVVSAIEPLNLGAFTLTSGDCDGDNEITSTDLSIILSVME